MKGSHVQNRDLEQNQLYISTIKTFGGKPRGYFHFLLSSFKVNVMERKKERKNCESIHVAFDLMIILNRVDNSDFN